MGIPDTDTQEPTSLSPSLCSTGTSRQPPHCPPAPIQADRLGTDSPTHHRALCANVFYRRTAWTGSTQTLGHSSVSPTCGTNKQTCDNRHMTSSQVPGLRGRTPQCPERRGPEALICTAHGRAESLLVQVCKVPEVKAQRAPSLACFMSPPP